MASAAPSISVVIWRTRSAAGLTAGHGRRVRAAAEPSAAETIVVIDHAPALLARARAELGETCSSSPNEREQGLGGARNMGVSVAGGSVVAFLDDDAEAEHGMARAARGAVRGPGRHGRRRLDRPGLEGTAPAWFPAEFLWVVGCTYRGMPEDVSPVRNLIGCNMSYRRAVIDELGRVPPRLRMRRDGVLHPRAAAWPDRRLVYVPVGQRAPQRPATAGGGAHFRSRCFFEGARRRSSRGSRAVRTRSPRSDGTRW